MTIWTNFKFHFDRRLNMKFRENWPSGFRGKCVNWLIVLGFNKHQPLWVILCCLPEKGRKEIVGDMKERDGVGCVVGGGGGRGGEWGKRNLNGSKETEELKTFPLYPYLLQGQQALPNYKPIPVGRPGDARHTSPNHPKENMSKRFHGFAHV